MNNECHYLTPPKYAERLGCKSETVIGLIRSGELRAFDISKKTATRPRYRISMDAIIEFENNRSGKEEVTKKQRRTKKQSSVVNYF